MRLDQRARRRESGRRKIYSAAGRIFVIDALESRQMLSGTGETVQTPIPPVLANVTTPSNNSVTLNQYFNDSTLPGTLATFNTSEGEIQVALTDAATPQTVANFLYYVNSGEYDDTIFHRSVDLTNNNGGSPSDPGTIIQGGGYSIMNGSIGHIATTTPVNDEYTTELYGDVAGTLAMAKTSSADSATSEWYFNVTDNTELDTPTTDPNTGAPTSYTVFGNVLSGTDVISAIAALPTTSLGSGLTNVPIVGLTEAQVAADTPIGESNLVYTYGITTEPGTSYTVSSDNSALVKPTVTNGVLSFTYGSGFGTANITINASNLDGTSASTIVSVTVPNTATPTAGPVSAPFTAPFTVTGTAGTFSVLGPDTDSTAALNPGTVTITVPPTNGTASVNASNGFISYTPNAGYVGPDSLTYTVADANGAVSAPAVVTLDAVPTAVQVSVKPGQTLVFDQPDGIVGHLKVTGGVASVTFTTFQVTTTTKGAVIVASGAGADITSVNINNSAGSLATLTVTANGPFSLGSVNDQGDLLSLTAPNATLTGTCDFGFVQAINVASINAATLTMGAVNQALPERDWSTNLTVPNVIDSNMNFSGGVGTVRSNQWLNNDNGQYTFATLYIQNLIVTGVFDETLDLSYTTNLRNSYALAKATVGEANGTWNIAGSVNKLNLGTPGTNFSLTVGAVMVDLTFTGNFANTIEAAAFDEVTVKGSTSNAVVQADGTFGKYLLVGRLNFIGAVSNTVIFSSGSIGSITAPSLTGSRIYAGVELTIAQDAALANSSSGLTNNASIGSIVLTSRAASAFSDSLISADILGAVRLGKVDSSNGGSPEGISAHAVSSISATLVPGGVVQAGPAQLRTAAQLMAYETKAKLTLGDFQIDLF